MTESLSGASNPFGIKPISQRTNNRPEANSMAVVLKELKAHPAASWREQINSETARLGKENQHD